MNNELIRNHYDAYIRMQAFGEKYTGRFAPGSLATALFTALAGVVTTMEAGGVGQISGKASYHGGTHGKRLAAEQLRAELRAIHDTAEAIALADGLPEFDSAFYLSRSTSYVSLLTRAKAILQAATPHSARFIEFEMPANFLTELAADIERFEALSGGQDAGLASQVSGTAGLSAAVVDGIQLRRQLLALVRNKFKHDIAILAEWESAARIVRIHRSSEPKPQATAVG